MKIRYLGKQPKHRDRWFGAGVTWTPGEVQEVNDESGRKLVEKWPEIYAIAESPTVEATDKERPPIDLDKATRAEMADYAEVHFGVEVNRNGPRPDIQNVLAALLAS